MFSLRLNPVDDSWLFIYWWTYPFTNCISFFWFVFCRYSSTYLLTLTITSLVLSLCLQQNPYNVDEVLCGEFDLCSSCTAFLRLPVYSIQLFSKQKGKQKVMHHHITNTSLTAGVQYSGVLLLVGCIVSAGNSDKTQHWCHLTLLQLHVVILCKTW